MEEGPDRLTLDTATLFIASVAIDFGIALYFWTLWLGQRSQPIHRWVAASATSAMAGCFLYMLRQVVPDWVAVWAAQVCFIQIFAFLWAAVGLVHGRTRSPVAIWAGSAAWTAACLVPPFFAAEQPRNVLATLAFTAYCLAMSVEVMGSPRSRPTPSRVLTTAALVLLSALSVGLAVYTALQDEVVAPLRQSQPLAALWLLVYLVVYIVLVLAVTTLELGNEAERQRAVATTDGLTGLLNRRAFFERAEGATARQGAAALLLDIDHFKQINDAWGHAAGDAALVRFAALLRQATAGFGPGDETFLARVGGEEFVCLLPGARGGAAAGLAEAIRGMVEAERPAGGPRMTVSIGWAVSPAGERSLDALLQAADRALYRAKKAGRNRVEGEDAASERGAAEAFRPEAVVEGR